jgi:hypothetical protein
LTYSQDVKFARFFARLMASFFFCPQTALATLPFGSRLLLPGCRSPKDQSLCSTEKGHPSVPTMRHALRPGVAVVKSALLGAGPEGFSLFWGKTPDPPFGRPPGLGCILARFCRGLNELLLCGSPAGPDRAA